MELGWRTSIFTEKTEEENERSELIFRTPAVPKINTGCESDPIVPKPGAMRQENFKH